jgi:meso-butanediol dehydrogenase/(S,S)-butanediol dehydrogenase/diacetyl reductase
VSKGAVLISGAAGGIGAATVDRFLESGYEVAGLDISPAVETLRTNSYRGKAADVTDPERLVAAVEELLEGMELRHVVGLAGRVVVDEPGSIEPDVAAAVDGFSRSLSLNLTGQYALIQAALPKLSEATGDRSITLCSSVNALRGYGAPAYSAAKAGLIGMAHVLASPLGRRGIRVNVVAPGTTRTPLVEEEIRTAKDHTRLDRAARQIPLGRVAEPDDVAAVIESLAVRMTYVSDEVIKIDGGQLLAQPVDPSSSRLRRWLHNRPFR